MYQIRLTSGRELSFDSVQEFADAIASGAVGPGALIYHQRSNRWLPVENHPQFRVAQSLIAGAAKPGKAPPSPVAPPGPIAPPAPTAPPDPGRSRVRPRRRFNPTMLAASILVIGGAAAGLGLGFKLRSTETPRVRPGPPPPTPAPSFDYRPAPAPSSLLRGRAAPAPVSTDTTSHAAAAAPTAHPDPLAPASAAELIARYNATYDSALAVLDSGLVSVNFAAVFGARTFAGPGGAREAERSVGAAVNLVKAYRQAEVMIEQAYADTAAYQADRAGWGPEDRKAWDGRRVRKESFDASERSRQLLADADSVLTVLGRTGLRRLEGDTLAFAAPAIAVAYSAARGRLAAHAGSTEVSADTAPVLAVIRRALDPVRLPAGNR